MYYIRSIALYDLGTKKIWADIFEEFRNILCITISYLH